MADVQKQVDLAFAELDIVEEMLRPLVSPKTQHEHEDSFRIPITQTEEFQLFSLLLEQRLNHLKKNIVSTIGADYQRNCIDSAMLMAVTEIRDLSE